MVTRIKNIEEKYYFTERLKIQIGKMHKYPLTILEAPSGFGKTTAVREYLNGILTDENHSYWYTCLGESSSKVWSGIFDLIGHVDSLTAIKLKKLDLTKLDSLADMAILLRNMSFEIETYLVIDNFQLIGDEIPKILVHFFASHDITNLHVVILTQQLEISQQLFFHNENILNIDSSYFIFDKESIARYFRMSGLRIKESELDSIHKNAAGWIAAVRLHLINYKEKGIFEQTNDIGGLLKSAIWDKLNQEEKDFLMSVSVLDSFTPHQAALMSDRSSLTEKMLKLINDNAFINYLPDDHVYSMHSILQDFLRNQFYSMSDPLFQKLILKRAGESCLDVLDYNNAIQFFYKIEDYDVLLSLPLRDDYFIYDDERYLVDWIVRLVRKCPKETLVKYPMSLITFAFQLILFGQYEDFGYLCELIDSALQNPVDLSESELRSLKGEIAFVQSFTEYNNIEKMVVRYKDAYELLGRPSRFNLLDEAWTYGGVSVLYMFWSKVDKLESTIDCLETNLPYYTKLSRGHGMGGDCVMRAEAMLMRGNDNDAEALCHKALYMASSKRQTSVCICAELVLARIALLRGDANGYHFAVERILQYLESPLADLQIKRMVELCLATLNTSIGEKDVLPDWIIKIDKYSHEIFAAIQPYCHIIYVRHLLMNKRYNEICGLTSTFIDMANEMNYTLPQVYQYLYLAIVKKIQGKFPEAQEYLAKALTLALPDKVYLPFAEHATYVLPMLEEFIYSEFDRDSLSEVMALCRKQEAGVNAVRKTLSKSKTVLTARETEVAMLAKEGHAVKKIAQMLFISDATVKTILKNIYSKLDIHSKVQLGKINL